MPEKGYAGYYAVHSINLSANFRLIKRVSDVLNVIASIELSRIWQRQLEARLENNLYTDFIADLPNLKGLTRWYTGLGLYILRPGLPV